MSGNSQPALFENHGIDSRYPGPHEVAPTMSARYGTGGNTTPLVSGTIAESYCIAGNIIDRAVHNGGNGFGCQPNISYTLNTADRHCVYSRQRSDVFQENEVTATQSARQHKDATDLVAEHYQEAVVRTLVCGSHKGIGAQYAGDVECGGLGENLAAFQARDEDHGDTQAKLIRRLTVLECERLQGYQDGWTDIPGASDSARYKALGNSVAIPCVAFVMRGIAYFLEKNNAKEGKPCTSIKTI